MEEEKSTHVYFGLEEQTVDALELTLESLKQVPSRMSSWKWAIIGMHAALQGSFCVALRRTDGSQTLIPEQERQFWERVESERATGIPGAPIYTTPGGKQQDEKVDWFLELFAKTQDPNRMSYMAGVPLEPTPEQTESVEWINRLRGRLIHFGATGITTDARSLLGDIENGLAIVETLLTRTLYMSDQVWGGPLDTMADPDLADKSRELIDAIRKEIAMVRNRYGIPSTE